MQCGHCVYFKQDHEFSFWQSRMVICDSERKETVTKSVAMVTPHTPLSFWNFSQWRQVSFNTLTVPWRQKKSQLVCIYLIAMTSSSNFMCENKLVCKHKFGEIGEKDKPYNVRYSLVFSLYSPWAQRFWKQCDMCSLCTPETCVTADSCSIPDFVYNRS